MKVIFEMMLERVRFSLCITLSHWSFLPIIHIYLMLSLLCHIFTVRFKVLFGNIMATLVIGSVVPCRYHVGCGRFSVGLL